MRNYGLDMDFMDALNRSRKRRQRQACRKKISLSQRWNHIVDYIIFIIFFPFLLAVSIMTFKNCIKDYWQLFVHKPKL